MIRIQEPAQRIIPLDWGPPGKYTNIPDDLTPVVDNQNVTPTYVTWQTDGAGCPTCQEAEEEGVQPLGHVFVTGVAAPPAHKNCHCALQDVSNAQDYYGYISG